MRYNNYNKILKNIDEPIAFVLSPYLTTGLGVIRSLGRQGVPVFWLDSNPKQIGFFSKYCLGIICPNPKNNEGEYIEFLMDIGEKLGQKGVIFPTGDIETMAILKNRRKLEKYFRIPMSDLETSKIFLNKRLFYQALEKQGISHPPTYFPVDISEVKALSKEIKYPCIVKPSYSGYFRSDFHTKFFMVKSSDELIPLYDKASSRNHDVMIQEIIPGNVRNMYGLNAYFDKKFEPLGTFMYRRIREWPHGFGNGCFIESVNIPELEKTMNSFVKRIKYNGIMDAEFRKDPRDGLFKFIEVNARCWMQVSLPTRCGVNLPYMAYMDAIGKNVAKATCNNKHVKWFYMYEDILSSLKSMLKDDFSFREWVDSFRGEKEHAIYARDDLLPFFVFYLKSFYFDIPFFLKQKFFKNTDMTKN